MKKLEVTTDEASVLYSACLAFGDELKNMQGRTAAMNPFAGELGEKASISLAEQLGGKAKICYELAQRIAELSEKN